MTYCEKLEELKQELKALQECLLDHGANQDRYEMKVRVARIAQIKEEMKPLIRKCKIEKVLS